MDAWIDLAMAENASFHLVGVSIARLFSGGIFALRHVRAMLLPLQRMATGQESLERLFGFVSERAERFAEAQREAEQQQWELSGQLRWDMIPHARNNTLLCMRGRKQWPACVLWRGPLFLLQPMTYSSHPHQARLPIIQCSHG